jgi:hypothetical protein
MSTDFSRSPHLYDPSPYNSAPPHCQVCGKAAGGWAHDQASAQALVAIKVKSVGSVRLTADGARFRVLNGKAGMVFEVDKTSFGLSGLVVHVRDHRFTNGGKPYQIWSLGAEDYELIND